MSDWPTDHVNHIIDALSNWWGNLYQQFSCISTPFRFLQTDILFYILYFYWHLSFFQIEAKKARMKEMLTKTAIVARSTARKSTGAECRASATDRCRNVARKSTGAQVIIELVNTKCVCVFTRVEGDIKLVPEAFIY